MLTAEETDDCISAFKQFSRRTKGTVPMNKLGTVMRRAGFAPTKDEIENLSKACPFENAVKQDAFMRLMEIYKTDVKTQETLHEAFAIFDKTGEGFFTTESLKELLSATEDSLSNEEIVDLCSKADSDGDGKIKFEDFVRVMLSP